MRRGQLLTRQAVNYLVAAAAACADSGMERIYLSFALGKALEDRADYTASWHCYAQGNALPREGLQKGRLVLVELLQNAVEHGFGHAPGTIRLVVERPAGRT